MDRLTIARDLIRTYTRFDNGLKGHSSPITLHGAAFRFGISFEYQDALAAFLAENIQEAADFVIAVLSYQITDTSNVHLQKMLSLEN